MYFGEGDQRNRCEIAPQPPTNNRAELWAIHLCLESCRRYDHLLTDPGTPLDQLVLRIETDSQYAITVLNPNSEVTAKKNLDLVNQIRKEIELFHRKIELVWTKAHCGTIGNERADILAGAASLQGIPSNIRKAPKPLNQYLKYCKSVFFQTATKALLPLPETPVDSWTHRSHPGNTPAMPTMWQEAILLASKVIRKNFGKHRDRVLLNHFLLKRNKDLINLTRKISLAQDLVAMRPPTIEDFAHIPEYSANHENYLQMFSKIQDQLIASLKLRIQRNVSSNRPTQNTPHNLPRSKPDQKIFRLRDEQITWFAGIAVKASSILELNVNRTMHLLAKLLNVKYKSAEVQQYTAPSDPQPPITTFDKWVAILLLSFNSLNWRKSTHSLLAIRVTAGRLCLRLLIPAPPNRISSSNEHITICSFNFGGTISPQMADDRGLAFQHLIKSNSIDVLCIQEARLTADRNVSKHFPKKMKRNIGSSQPRFSNVDRSQGGVATLSRLASESNDLSDDGIDCIRTTFQNSYVIYNIYMPPEQTREIQCQQIIDAIESDYVTQKRIVIVGDMNVDYKQERTSDIQRQRVLERILNAAPSLQIIESYAPTFRRQQDSTTASYIDHTYTSSNTEAKLETLLTFFPQNQHRPLILRIKPRIQSTNNSSKRQMSRKTFELANKATWTDIVLQQVLSNPDKDIDQAIAEATLSMNPKKTQDILFHIISKAIALGHHRNAYRVLSRSIRYREILEIYLNGKPHLILKRNQQAGSPVAPQEQVTSQAFQDAWEATWNPEGLSPPDSHDNNNAHTFVDSGIRFNNEQIQKAIKSLKPKAGGLSGSSPQMYKTLSSSEEFIHRLVTLFNNILSGQELPASWYASLTIFLYKKGDPLNPLNYRPISLTETSFRIFEIALKPYLLESTLSNTQFGFRHRLSTTFPLFTLLTCAQQSKLDKKPLFVVALDVKKAFDSVPHDQIRSAYIQNNYSVGIANLFYSLATNHYAITSETSTRKLYFRKGVLQGGVLSPFHFNISTDQVLSLDATGPGVKIGEHVIHGSRFADDTALLGHDADEIARKNTQHTLNLRAVGLEQEPSKAAAIILGHNRAMEVIHQRTIKNGEFEIPLQTVLPLLGISIRARSNSMTRESNPKLINHWTRVIQNYANKKADRIPVSHLTYILNSQIIAHCLYGSEIAKIPKNVQSKINKARRTIVRASCPGFAPAHAVDEFLSQFSIQAMITKRLIKAALRFATSKNPIVAAAWKTQMENKLPFYHKLKQCLERAQVTYLWNAVAQPDCDPKLILEFQTALTNNLINWQRRTWANKLKIPIQYVNNPGKKKKNTAVYRSDNGFGTELFHLRWYSEFKKASQHQDACFFCRSESETPFHVIFECNLSQAPNAASAQRKIRKLATTAGEQTTNRTDPRLIRLTSYAFSTSKVLKLRKAATELFQIRATITPPPRPLTEAPQLEKRKKSPKRTIEEKRSIVNQYLESPTTQDRIQTCLRWETSMETIREWDGEIKQVPGSPYRPQHYTNKRQYVIKETHRKFIAKWMKFYLRIATTQTRANELANNKATRHFGDGWKKVATSTAIKWMRIYAPSDVNEESEDSEHSTDESEAEEEFGNHPTQQSPTVQTNSEIDDEITQVEEPIRQLRRSERIIAQRNRTVIIGTSIHPTLGNRTRQDHTGTSPPATSGRYQRRGSPPTQTTPGTIRHSD